MPVVKGGVWTNIEDEILKASVSKYGLNQWARVSSLLARKTPKQCKARWTEWLDPAIRKLEWSKQEDEKLLHLAKLMPTQWRTIAPIVGRTANQCLERYSRLLDEAEARENDELALRGQEGGETAAPSSDDVRKLRPGEMDVDPESKPAKPDTIDMDEDEKEMLSEARARLANTQGKKAKRKARERQLEESRRLALLQKRRELKSAGINIKINHKKKGQMDYNADIPFEKAPAAGFYDTLEEIATNEKEKEAFDPRKQQLARKRQGDPEDDSDSKRQKKDKTGDEAGRAAAARAAQIQKMREADQQSKRRPLNLPAPQVSESEMEDIIKMGAAGRRAIESVAEDDRGLIQRYDSMTATTPIRTPRTQAGDDRIANEIRNIQALNNTQSSLLGGENTPLHTGPGSTGFAGANPAASQLATPNPMKTPLSSQRPTGPDHTPLRTPRDTYSLNSSMLDPKSLLRAKLASLPRPKATEFELELPEEQQADVPASFDTEIDQEEIDRQLAEAEEAKRRAEFRRQTQVMQRSLPRSHQINYSTLLAASKQIDDPIRRLIAEETALLMANDYKTTNKTKMVGVQPKPVQLILDEYIDQAQDLIRQEVQRSSDTQQYKSSVGTYYSMLPTASAVIDNDIVVLSKRYASTADALVDLATVNNDREKPLKKLLGGYVARQRTLKTKIGEGTKQLEDERNKLAAFDGLRLVEEEGLRTRLTQARDEVMQVKRQEREVMDAYRLVKEEAQAMRLS